MNIDPNKKIVMRYIPKDYDAYSNADGWSFKREYGEFSPGMSFNGRWVLRAPDGEYIDHDGNRHDLAQRNRIVLA